MSMSIWDLAKDPGSPLGGFLRERHDENDTRLVKFKLKNLVERLQEDGIIPDFFGMYGRSIPLDLEFPYGNLSMQLGVKDPFFIVLDEDQLVTLREKGKLTGAMYGNNFSYRIVEGRINQRSVMFRKDLAGAVVGPSGTLRDLQWIEDVDPELETYRGKWVEEIGAYHGKYGTGFLKKDEFLLRPRPGLLSGENKPTNFGNTSEIFDLAKLLTE